MSVVVAEGLVELTTDATSVPRDVARDINGGGSQVSAAGEGMGKKIFGGVLGAWAAIGGAQAVVGFFSGAITGASDLSETMSKSKAIFGDQQVVIESFAKNAAVNLGLSQSAAMSAAAGFGDLFSQIGFTSDQAAAMSQQVVIAAADLGSFSNLETADVAERISAAFRGEYDSLQAVIPNISAARVESEAMAASGKSVASELTAAEKATAVMSIVTKDGARAMGDFARTSDGAANSSKIISATFEDQKAKLGAQLMPAWQGFLGFLSGTALPMFSDLVDWIGKNSDTVVMLAATIAGAAITYGVVTTAMGIYKSFQVASAAATGGLTVAQWALNAAMTANPIGVVIVAIAALVAGIIWVATQTTFFQDAWAVMSEAIGTAATWLWETVLEPVFTAIGNIVTWLYEEVIAPVFGAIVTAFTWLSDGITAVFEVIGEIFNWLYENVISPVVMGILIYVGIWAGIFTWLWETVLSPIFAGIGELFNWVYNTIIVPVVGLIIGYIQLWAGVFTWLYETVIGPVFAGIGALFGWIYNSVILPAVGFITSAITGIGAVFSWLWTNAVSPAFQALGTGFNWVYNSVIAPVIGFITTALGTVGTAVQTAFGNLSGFIGTAFNAVLGVIRTPINGIIGLVNQAIGSLNKLSVTIPDWVPEVGGSTWGLNLPRIPMLARGSFNAPGTFIAGEAGPELITGAGGARVYPSNQTRSMLGGGGGDNGDVLAALALLLEAVKAMPRGDTTITVPVAADDNAIVKARAVVREVVKGLGI